MLEQHVLHDKPSHHSQAVTDTVGLLLVGMLFMHDVLGMPEALQTSRPAACQAVFEYQLSSWLGHPGQPQAAAFALATFPPSLSAAVPSTQASANQARALCHRISSENNETTRKGKNVLCHSYPHGEP